MHPPLRRLVIPAALVSTLLSPLPPLASADWPVFRGDAAMTGVGSAAVPEKLEVRWQFATGEGKRTGSIEGAPAVADGLVFVASLDKHLYAVELATGKLKWKTRLGPMKASPAVRNGRVFVGDLEGRMYCVNAADGKVLWTFDTEGEIHAGVNFHGQNVLFGSHDSTLYCLDPDGKKVWDAKVDGPINAAAAVVGDLTFATGCSDGVLHVLDARTGKELGTIDLGGQTVATAAVHGERVFAAMESNQVVAADLRKREKVWTFEPARRARPFHASPAVAAGRVIAGSRDKKVYALDAASGKPLWEFLTEGMVDASPVVVGERVYVGCLSDAGDFYVLDLKTGREIQRLELDSPVTGSVAVGPDCLLVGTDRGVLFCLGKK